MYRSNRWYDENPSWEVSWLIYKAGYYNKEISWCEVQLSYSIGIEEPMAIYIKTDKGDIEPSKRIYEECKPRNIIKDLDLRNLSYEDKAAFGHFRD